MCDTVTVICIISALFVPPYLISYCLDSILYIIQVTLKD